MGWYSRLIMGKGINIKNTTPRSLAFGEDVIVVGGELNKFGIYADSDNLLLDGKVIATSSDPLGLRVVGSDLYFGDVKIGGETPPEPPTPIANLWIPPQQSASSYTPYTYDQLIALYDALMANNQGYITKGTYSEHGYGNYDLVHYVLTPDNYTKTFYLQAGIHGNEHDAPQTLYRIVDILCNHTNENAYKRLKSLRDNVRFVIIPVVNPWGYDNGKMNIPYLDWDGVLQDNNGAAAMNANRNCDYNHQYNLSAAGTGGNEPWQIAETRHIKSVIDSIGVKNIDYLVDYHDGGEVYQHLWINYNMDGANATMVQQLVTDLLAYEEANYPQYKDPQMGWVTDYCKDSSAYSSGSNSAWYNCTIGAFGSVCEYIGGYFGYSFTAEQMTRSLRIRANMIIYAYEMLNTKGWTINEEQTATYFHWDYPIAMTRQGLRRDGDDVTTSHTNTTIEQVYDRWDALASANPSYVTKSESLGQNDAGVNIYSYTLGCGSKKVLFIGGALRWSASHKETEFGIYVLAEYLCNSHIVSQSAFLQNLKQNYSIVVLPCIDINAGSNNTVAASRSLNASYSSYAKWLIVNNKCAPTNYALNTAHDVPIFLSFLQSHQDALMLLSGGEDTSGYAFEYPKYTTEYMTQIIIPMDQSLPQVVQDYLDHLEIYRGEDAPIIEHTTGKTFGDYAYDNYGIPTIYLNMQVSQMWSERSSMAQSGDTAGAYLYRNYETGRRIANIANLFLCYG